MASIIDLPSEILAQILSEFRVSLRLMLIHRRFREAVENRRYQSLCCFEETSPPWVRPPVDQNKAVDAETIFEADGIVNEVEIDEIGKPFTDNKQHTTKIHLLLRTLIMRPDLARSVKKLQLVVESFPLRPEMLANYSPAEMEQLKNLEDWHMLKLGNLASFVAAIFRLCNPKCLNTGRVVLERLQDSFRMLPQLRIDALEMREYSNSLDTVPLDAGSTIDVILRFKLKSLFMSGCYETSLRSDSLKRLYIETGLLRSFQLPNLVSFEYDPKENFSMPRLVRDLMASRHTLEVIKIELAYLHEWEGGAASFFHFPRLKILHLAVPLLDRPFMETVPSQVMELDLFENPYGMLYVLDELASCLINGNTKLDLATYHAQVDSWPDGLSRNWPGIEIERLDDHGQDKYVVRKKLTNDD